MQDSNTNTRNGKRPCSPSALDNSPPTSRQRSGSEVSGIHQRDSGTVLTEDTKMHISGDRRLETAEEILKATASAPMSSQGARPTRTPVFRTVNTSVLATRRTWMAVEDPLSDSVYKSPHQRRINYDIWQNNQLLLELAVEDHEEFEARLQALRDTLGVLHAAPISGLEKWFETMEMRMVKIRTRACAILIRGGTVAGRRKKSRPPTPGGNGEEEGGAGLSSRQSAAEAWGQSAGEEEDNSFEESGDEVSGDEEDTDEESEEDGDDDDYH